MPEDNENKKKFIKIPIEKQEKIRIQTGGRGGPHLQISKQDFLNKITKAVSLGSIRLKAQSKTYFLLDLHENYYSDNVKNTLKKLNLNIETIFEPKKIFVSGDTNQLQDSNVNSLPQYVFKTIKNIDMLESSNRIGSNLRKLM